MTEMEDEPMAEPRTADARDSRNTGRQAVELPARRLPFLQLGIGAGVMTILVIGGLTLWRADARTNKVAVLFRQRLDPRSSKQSQPELRRAALHESVIPACTD
jgi:hypothetical protein